jgi:hypothetical protein
MLPAMATLDWLQDRVREPILAATAAVERVLGEGLVAVCLIGAAAEPARGRSGRQPGHSATAELLLIARALPPETLRALASALVEPLCAGLQIRMVTQAELRGSVDVHALELAQWRDQHLRLVGDDPFAELELRPADLRHEIERALRTLSHRLRNRLLWCLATEQQRLDVILRESLDRLTNLARHTLALLAAPRPSDDGAVLEAFMAWVGTDPQALAALRERLLAEGQADDPIAELAALAAATEAATAKVDSLLILV